MGKIFGTPAQLGRVKKKKACGEGMLFSVDAA